MTGTLAAWSKGLWPSIYCRFSRCFILNFDIFLSGTKKGLRCKSKPLIILAPPDGLEPPT